MCSICRRYRWKKHARVNARSKICEEKYSDMEKIIAETKESCLHGYAENSDLNQMLTRLSKKHIYKNMFDYLKSVAAELGEDRSFYTMDFGEVLWKYQQWQDELPGVKMFYAVKANPDRSLLKFLVILGASFDCATVGEIRYVLKAGCTPDRIIFANPNITTRDLKYARQVGVDLLTFDNEVQLRKIHNIYPNSRLLVRLKPPQVKCKFDFSEKFGCSFNEAGDLLKTAKELEMDIVGVSFHVGSLNTRASIFTSALRDARRVFDIGRSLGFHFHILDIGGGFQGSVGTDHFFKKTAATIREALSHYFPMDSVQIIAEPGCYVVCSAATLTTTVFAKRTVHVSNDKSPEDIKQLYFLNNGIYSSFAPGIQEYNIHPVPLLKKHEQRAFFSSTLSGQTLCPMDVIMRDIPFPDMKIGEAIAWINMGAYSRSICTEFCGFPLPDFRYVFRINSKLKTDWISKYGQQLTKFLSRKTHLIAQDDEITTNFYEERTPTCKNIPDDLN